VYSLKVGHQLVNKARPSPSKSVGAAKRHAKDSRLLACLHAHPRRQTTLYDGPTTRLLAWEIAVVDSFHKAPIVLPPHHRDHPARAIYFTSLHTPHQLRVVAGHTQASIAHHNNSRINKSISNSPHNTTLLRMDLIPCNHHHERTPDLSTSR